jgi:hypothetical protein
LDMIAASRRTLSLRERGARECHFVMKLCGGEEFEALHMLHGRRLSALLRRLLLQADMHDG